MLEKGESQRNREGKKVRKMGRQRERENIGRLSTHKCDIHILSEKLEELAQNSFVTTP